MKTSNKIAIITLIISTIFGLIAILKPSSKEQKQVAIYQTVVGGGSNTTINKTINVIVP